MVSLGGWIHSNGFGDAEWISDTSSKCEHATVFDDVVNGLLLVAALHPAVSMMRHLCIRCSHHPCRVFMRLTVVH